MPRTRITGTSKRYVAMDYGNKLQHGLLMAHAVILRNVFRLAQVASKVPVNTANIILDTFRMSPEHLPIKSILNFTDKDSERIVFVFNPLARTRETVLHLISETPNLVITNANGDRITYQISPVVNDQEAVGNLVNKLRVTFYIKLGPLGLMSLNIKTLGPRTRRVKIAERLSTSLYSTAESNFPGFVVRNFTMDEPIILANKYLTAVFSPDSGMLKSIKTFYGKSHKVEMEFKKYNVCP